MSRQKPKAVIENLDDANDALYDIALCQLELQKIDTKASERVAAAQKEAELEGRVYRADIDKNEALILAFAEKKKGELFAESGKANKDKKRAQKLTFGKFGYQKSTSIEIKDEKEVIKLIEIKKKKLAVTLGLNAAIKREPKIQKKELQKFNDETLKQFGITRKSDDTFFYETDIDAVNLDLQKSKTA